MVFTGVLAGTATASPVRPGFADPNAPLGGVVPAGPRHASQHAIDAFRTLRTRHAHAIGPQDQIHNFWGPMPPNDNTSDGIMATQSVATNLQIPNNGDVVYAPTMKLGNGSCVEIVTAYAGGSAPQVWAWDWCQTGNLAKQVDIDSTFLSTYTTTANGQPAYTVRIQETDTGSNAWTAYLYNYTTNAWDSFFVSSGTDQTGLSYGWDIFEIYSSIDSSTGNGYYCAAAAGDTFESSAIQLHNNGAWAPANASDSPVQPAQPNPSDYQCPNLQFTVVNPDDHWTVADPA